MTNPADVEALGTVLATLESQDEELAAKTALFIQENLLDDDPDSYRIAHQYAAWALTHPDLARREEVRYKCSCWRGSGWIFDEHGDVKPCDKCKGTRADHWQREFMDSNEAPR